MRSHNTHRIVRRNPTPTTQPLPTGADGNCRRSDVTVPGCDTVRQTQCDVQMVNGVLRSLAASTGDYLQMAPIRSDYFQPLAEKAQIVDATNSDINRRAEFQSIKINDIPQEPFSGDLSPTSATAGLSDFFGPEFDGYGKPVAYGIYSQPNLIFKFRYGIQSISTVPITVYVTHFGNSLQAIPPNMVGGQPFNGGQHFS